MKKIDITDPSVQTGNPVGENISQLQQLFPEAFSEGKIDFEVLKQLLGGEVDDSDERFGLNWHGKKRARQIALTPSSGTLRPCPEESVDWDTTQNLMIEGDNLEVLKLLQKSYAGKVKMIYIDPPYNTGKDFVYPDNFQDSIANYKAITGQTDEEGLRVSSNTETSGRYHTDWLNMMYPRLKLARNLLRDDGVIFISIDDSEIDNLKKVCGEIFGEFNFLAELVWNLTSGPQAGHFTRSHEYILVYAKYKDSLDYFIDTSGGNIKHGALKKISRVNPASEINFKKGSIQFDGDNAIFTGEIGGSEKQYIKSPHLKFEGGVLADDVTIEAGWAMKNQLISWLDGKETYDSKGQKVIRFYFNSKGILFYEKERGTFHPKTVIPTEVGNTKTGSEQVIKLLGDKVMDFPKPTNLIEFFIKTISQGENNIILDFFAGSGTTGHAVMQQNAEDDGHRRYILVQLPEPVDNKQYSTIADITKERLRRAGQKIKSENPDWQGDTGFRVFKLDSSNIRPWQASPDNLELMLDAHVSSVIDGRSEADLETELMLRRGVMLSESLQTREVAGLQLRCAGNGILFSCLAPRIPESAVEPLADAIADWHKALNADKNSACYFLDSAFDSNVAKANLSALLKQHGLSNVFSL